MIKVENILKRYDDKIAINNISFEIKKGEICGYIGPNGAGKTTTVKMIMGLIDPDSGSVFIDNLKVDQNKNTIKSIVGYVPESGFLFEPLRANEFLTFVGKMHGIDEAVIRKRIDLFSELLDIRNDLDKPMTSFSKGMKQKSLIISALIHLPDIIILDEPLNGLDASSMLLFKELIGMLAKQNKTVFYSSHLLDVVEKMCDSLIILKKGEIVAEGAISEIKKIGNGKSLEMIYNDLINEFDYKTKVEKFVSEIGK